MLALLLAVALSDTLRYAITIQGNPAGRQTTIRGPAETTVLFEFTDRGRGPKTETRFSVDPKNLPTSVTITGNDYLKQAVDERLTSRTGAFIWSNSGERGAAARRSAFYLPREAPPEFMALLVRAALKAPTTGLTLLPSGKASIAAAATETVSGDGGGRTVTLYAVSGLGFAPDYLWLEGDGTLFAALSGWQGLVREGYQPSTARLAVVQDSVSGRREGDLARQLSIKAAGPVAFTNAAVFDPVTRRVTRGQTILVEGDRISAVGPTATMRLSSTTKVIDATGKTVLPGLWDMHAHLSAVDGRLDIAAGVTSVRDMANDVDYLLATRKAFDEGTGIGPRVVMAGFIDGPGPYAGPTKALVSTREQALEWVDRYASLGYEQIKLYSSLDPALVPIIAERAHAKGMRLSGHIPRGMLAHQAVAAGYDEIQHTNMLFLNFLGDTLDTRTPLRFTTVAKYGRNLDLAADSVRRFIAYLKDKGTVVDPTLATFEGMFTSDPDQLSPGDRAVAGRVPAQVRRGMAGGGLPADSVTRAVYRASYRNMLAMVKALFDAGVPLVAGTDCTAGFCLHRELELYVEAGIPAAEVLRIATLGAATVMHRADRLGTLEPGKLADLIVVAGDPTRRIGDIRKVDWVMKDGILFDPARVYASLGVAPWRPARR